MTNEQQTPVYFFAKVNQFSNTHYGYLSDDQFYLTHETYGD